MISFDASESSRDERATIHGGSGTIVLSERRRVLFIDQRATELVELLISTLPPPALTTALPPCLMDVIEEMLARHTPEDIARPQELDRIDRLVGSAPSFVHVRGISVPASNAQSRRIILILSASSTGADTLTVIS